MITKDKQKFHKHLTTIDHYACIDIHCPGCRHDILLVSHNHDKERDIKDWKETWKCTLCNTEFTV